MNGRLFSQAEIKAATDWFVDFLDKYIDHRIKLHDEQQSRTLREALRQEFNKPTL